MNDISISIVTLCYNSAHFISATLDMLVSQGLGDCEVIMVSEGSTDSTTQLVRRYAECFEETSRTRVSPWRATRELTPQGRVRLFP